MSGYNNNILLLQSFKMDEKCWLINELKLSNMFYPNINEWHFIGVNVLIIAIWDHYSLLKSGTTYWSIELF